MFHVAYSFAHYLFLEGRFHSISLTITSQGPTSYAQQAHSQPTKLITRTGTSTLISSFTITRAQLEKMLTMRLASEVLPFILKTTFLESSVLASCLSRSHINIYLLALQL